MRRGPTGTDSRTLSVATSNYVAGGSAGYENQALHLKQRKVLTQLEMSCSSVCEQSDSNVFVVTGFVDHDSFGITDNSVVIFSFYAFIATFFFENLCKQSCWTYCKNGNANNTLTYVRISRNLSSHGSVARLNTEISPVHTSVRMISKRRKPGGRGAGAVLPEKSGGGVQPASQNPYPIYDQNLRFSLPYL